MSEPDQERKEKYKRVRSDFDELNSEEKVIFLLEASITTVARGIDAFGRAISDEINDAFNKRARKKRDDASAAGETGAAEPPTNGEPPTPGESGSAFDDDTTDMP